MTFDTQERSREGSRPVELYEFTVGAETYRYSTSEDAIEFEGQVYTRRALGRDRIVMGQAGPSPLNVTLPADDDFVVRHAATIPTTTPRCRIRRHQRGSAEAVTIFNGTVASANFTTDARAAVLAIQSDLSSGNLALPRYSHGVGCNHQLYGPGCLATPITFTSTVTSVDRTAIVVAGLAGFRVLLSTGVSKPRPFLNGFMRPVGIDDFRSIYEQEDDEVRVLYPFQSLQVGAAVVLTTGCAHNMDDCDLLYRNGPRYGGFPTQPRRNPFLLAIA